MNTTKKKHITILIIGILVFLIWQLPSLGLIRYPFILLGTWFHEMGHGLTAIVLGANFHHLEIYENGGGVAYTSYPNNLFLPLRITRALVATGGLLGPCFFGSLLIICSRNKKLAYYTLMGLVALLTISLIVWIRSLTGIIVLSLITIILSGILFKGKETLIQWTLLFLGLQCTLSTYLQLDYLFMSTFTRGGSEMISDTQAIANNLFGTHWIWAVLIIVISIITLWKSYGYYLRKV